MRRCAIDTHIEDNRVEHVNFSKKYLKIISKPFVIHRKYFQTFHSQQNGI